jgi:gamma-glutamyl:cysteine ligase YbdK (ATP-grasp superfamily)
MKSLTEVLKNTVGFITDAFLARLMFETTNTHLAPDEQKHAIILAVFKINCTFICNSQPLLKGAGANTYKTLQALGPEHEFSVVNQDLKPLPIVDRILKDLHGRIVNSVEFPRFSVGKELQLHVLEIRPNEPFLSPIDFEQTMQEAVLTVQDLLRRTYNTSLLGTGMHPFLRLDEARVWPHRHRQIYQEFSKVFSMKRHGWLNIQSFQLNLSYSNEAGGVRLHNVLAYVCTYLPALAASSPICEGRLRENVDNRLVFYKQNQKEIPSITGDVIPEYVSSFSEYRKKIVDRYSSDLARAGADKPILGKDWVNSRGVIFRFDRHALETRVMDEQECVKSDVALSCLTTALSRGLIRQETELPRHQTLVEDFDRIVKRGLRAEVNSRRGQTASETLQRLLKIARQNATSEEKEYFTIVQKRIEHGNLSDCIRRDVEARSRRTSLKEAIITVYSRLIGSLMDNQPYY